MREGGEIESGGLSRRTFLARGALAGLAASVPFMLDAKGLVEQALAQSPDMATDTFNGLVAFLVPGNDEYSVHQGDSTGAPGGIAAGATPALIANLDQYVPASTLGTFGASVPASGGVAALLNYYAGQANPIATGTFPSAFARLKSADKAKAMQRFEADPQWDNTEVKFVGGILPGFATFLAFSEAGVIDPATRKLKARPVGWNLTRYAGVREGRPELRGYYGGRRKAVGTKKRKGR